MATVDQFVLKIDVQGQAQVTAAIQSMNKLDQETVKTNGALAVATSNFLAVGAAAAAAATAFVTTADAMNMLNNRLELATQGGEAFVKSQEAIYRISQANGVGLKETAALYTRLADPVRTMGGGVKETTAIVDAFAKTLKISGANTAEAASSTLQFAQALGSGRLSGQELNAQLEANPRLMKALAEGMNVPIGQLKQMGSEGKLTSDVIGNALISQLDKLTEESQAMGTSVGQAFTRVSNEILLAVDNLNKVTGATTLVSNAFNGIAGIIKSVAEFITTFNLVVERMGGSLETAQFKSESLAAVMKVLGIVLQTVFRVIAVLVSNAVFLVEQFGLAIVTTGRAIVAAADGDWKKAPELFKQYATEASKAREQLNEFHKAILGTSDAMANARRAQFAATDPRRVDLNKDDGKPNKLKSPEIPLTEQEKTALAAAKGRVAVRQAEIDAARELNQVLASTIGMDTDLARSKIASAEIEAAYSKQIAELNAKISEEKQKGSKTSAGIIANLEKQKTLADDERKIKIEKLGIDQRANVVAQQRITSAQQLLNAQQLSIDLSMRQITAGNQQLVIEGQITQETARRQNAVAALAKEAADRIVNLESQISQATTQAQRDALSADLNNYRTYIANRQILLAESFKQEDDLRKSSAAGQVAFLDQLARSVDPFKIIQDKNAAVFNNMTQALDKFVDTGKLSFGDLAKSIIKDLIKIELRASATNLFKSAGGFSGIFNALTGAMGGGGTPMTDAATSNMFAGIKLGNRAQGGPVDRPTIVGEAGPEVFIPKSSGSIVPNYAMGGSSMTTNNTYVNNNISAVDAQSVAQLFANNRKTLLGVVETARKELPVRQKY